MTRDKKNFIYFATIHLTALCLALMGCATQNKSIGLGGAIGAGTGALVGSIADPGKDGEFRTRNVIVGTALGGISGMMAGASLHDEVDQQKNEAYSKGRASAQVSNPVAVPAVKNPKVDCRKVEKRIIGNRYIEEHRECVIVEPARWDEN